MVAKAGDPEANLAEAESHVARLADQGATVVVLPELFITGYDLDVDLTPWSESPTVHHLDQLIEWSRRWGLVIATAVLMVTPGGALMDVAVTVDRTGVIGSASKQYLWGREKDRFARRSEPGIVVKTEFGTLGVAICYEAGFPEIVRDLALRGAEIIAIPAAFGRPRLHAWELLTRSRALENGCFVVAAGLTGVNASGVEFAGHSRIVGPAGDILAGLADAPGVVMAAIDRDDVVRSRQAIPYLSDLTIGSRAAGAAETADIETGNDVNGEEPHDRH